MLAEWGGSPTPANLKSENALIVVERFRHSVTERIGTAASRNVLLSSGHGGHAHDTDTASPKQTWGCGKQLDSSFPEARLSRSWLLTSND